jgi:imidazolonepropionase-like amidohydrolase
VSSIRPERLARHRRAALAAASALALGALAFAPPLRAQLLEPAVVFQGARILNADGTIDEGLTIVARGGRIERIAKDPELPLLRRSFQLDGRIVTAGLIDVQSALGMSAAAAAAADPSHRTEDNFDRYASESLRDALRHGVTAVHVSGRGGAGIHTGGVVIRLAPDLDGSYGKVLARDLDLGIGLGSSMGALARIRVVESVRRELEAAREYRYNLEDYKEDLTEYEAKLKERAGKRSAGEKKAPEGAGQEKRAEGRGGRTKQAPFADEPPAPSGAPKAEKKAEKKDDLKKPEEPRRQPRLDAILQALERKIPVRIEARRAADILNAIEIARDFNLDWILEGGDELHRVLGALPRDARVVLGSQMAGDAADSEPPARLPSIAAALDRAGFAWAVGSGAQSGAEARFVLQNAELAISGSGKAGALALATSRAADFLGLAKDIGRIEPGRYADLVVWSGHPLDPGARVETVFVGGAVAYQAPKEAQ